MKNNKEIPGRWTVTKPRWPTPLEQTPPNGKFPAKNSVCLDDQIVAPFDACKQDRGRRAPCMCDACVDDLGLPTVLLTMHVARACGSFSSCADIISYPSHHTSSCSSCVHVRARIAQGSVPSSLLPCLHQHLNLLIDIHRL